MAHPQIKSNFDKLRERAEDLMKQSSASDVPNSLLNPDGLSKNYSKDEVLLLIHELEVNQIELEMQNDELILTNRQRELDYNKYVTLYDFAPLGYYTLSREGVIVELNFNGAKMLGNERLFLVSSKFSSFVSIASQTTFNLFLKSVFRSKVKEFCEVILIKSGSVPIFAHLIGIISDDGNHCYVNASDITEMKASEVSLRESKDKFKNLIQNMPVGVILQGPQTEILLCNNKSIELLGSTEDQILGKTSFDPDWGVIHEDGSDFPGLTHPAVRAIALGRPIRNVVMGVYRPTLGDRVWLQVDAEPQMDEDGKVLQVIVTFIDISERKRAEESLSKLNEGLENIVKERTDELIASNTKLQISYEKYRTVADYTNDWETWMGLEGEYIYVSPYCKLVTGYTADEFIRNPELLFNIVHPEDREWMVNHCHEEMSGNLASWEQDFRIVHKSGEERWIGHRCQSVFNAEGKFLGQRGSNRGITETKRVESETIAAEQQLRALSQKLNAVAEEERIRISREIHDELGPLLTALKFDIESIMERADFNADSFRDEMKSIMSMVDALIDSVRQIASELRPGILDHLGLLAAIEWQIRQFQLRTKIKCTYELDADVHFDKNETTVIYRILQEILTNVARHSKAKSLKISLIKRGNLFCMKVMDNGVGFDLKSDKCKNSLGLMGMRERAMSISGKLEIESIIGNGTTVTFSLVVL
jgi:PAS domain S-box-containing protein